MMNNKTIKNTAAGGQVSRCSTNRYSGRLKQNQVGMTLLEVIVAMFVLAIGVLALLATQLRSVSGVREAEGQTIVAQAVQNLIEGMLINPTLSPATASGVESGWTLKSYPDYVTSSSQKIEKDEGEIKYVNQGAISKKSLADKQKAQFSNELWRGLGGIPVHFVICRDTSGKVPAIKGGKMEANCTSGNNAPTYIKVAWLVEKEGSDALTAVNADGDYIVYTYQAQVTE